MNEFKTKLPFPPHCLLSICLFDWSAAPQIPNREHGKVSPPTPVLSLPVVPHVGGTDTDTLTEIPDRVPQEGEEEEDEFGYSRSKYCIVTGRCLRFAIS